MQRDTLFDRGGEMAQRMAAKDWTSTPLGHPSTWPRSLRAVVRVMLTSRYAMWMGWGKELTFFCNDAYLPTLGVKESWALTAFARSEDRQRALREGYQIHVAKPVEPSELLTVCASLAGRIGSPAS